MGEGVTRDPYKAGHRLYRESPTDHVEKELKIARKLGEVFPPLAGTDRISMITTSYKQPLPMKGAGGVGGLGGASVPNGIIIVETCCLQLTR